MNNRRWVLGMMIYVLTIFTLLVPYYTWAEPHLPDWAYPLAPFVAATIGWAAAWFVIGYRVSTVERQSEGSNHTPIVLNIKPEEHNNLDANCSHYYGLLERAPVDLSQRCLVCNPKVPLPPEDDWNHYDNSPTASLTEHTFRSILDELNRRLP